MRIPIGLQTWPEDTQLTAETLINCYAQQAPRTSRTPVRIRQAPGLTAHSTVTTSSATGRGFHVWDDKLFAVIGDSLFELGLSAAWTDRGTIVTEADVAPLLGAGNRLVSMASIAGDALVIATGGSVYHWNGSALSDISAAANVPVETGWVAEMNDRLIYGKRDSAEFVWSDVGDADTITGTSVLNAHGESDITRVGVVAGRELFCCGSRSIEVFYDQGTDVNTFVRSGDGIINRGVVSEYCVATLGNTLYFVGSDLKIYSLTGRTLRVISTPAIEEYLRTINTLRDCEAHAFSFGGSFFVVFQFPNGSTAVGNENGDERTYVFDAGTELWHQRESVTETWWRVRTLAEFDGGEVINGPRVFAGDRYSNQIWTLDDALLDEDGTAQTATIRTPYLENGGRRLTLHHVNAHVEFGGAVSGSPTIVLRTTKDGSNWSGTLSRSLGAAGATDARATWNRLGSHRKVALEFAMQGDTPKTLYYVEVEAEAGES